MRYFAMIDGERRGPFELSQLGAAGVGPETYVWCKGMDDWQQAGDVADICRHFRCVVFDRMHPARHVPVQQSQQPEPPEPPQAENLALIDMTDTTRPPSPTLLLSLLLTLFCFPITGFVAIYYSYKSRRAWMESLRSESKNNQQLYDEKERERLRKSAHNYDRQARMWIGITFFLGMIFYAFLGHKFA